MQEFLDKITSYNLFNNLLPGVIFSVLINQIAQIDLIGDDIFVSFFVCYFTGLVIGRFGSLIVEPILKKIGFLKFATYEAFVTASMLDNKIEILSETNNIYRSISSTLILILLIEAFIKLSSLWPLLLHYRIAILISLLLIIFLFSYRKQTQYIKSRINIYK